MKLNDTLIINGNALTKKYIESLSYEERKNLVEPIFNWFRVNGFPQPDKFDHLKKEYKRLADLKIDISKDEMFNNSSIATYISSHFCWDLFYSSTEINKKSVIDVFNDDALLKRVIFNRLGGDWLLDDKKGKGVNEAFRFSPKQIITGARSSRLAPAISIFKPDVAKFIYEKYSNKNDIIHDYSAGFGGRLLGAVSCERQYIGTDPLTTECLQKMVDYFGFKNIRLIKSGSEFEVLEENSVDFSFSSPPYYSQEFYSNDITQAYANGEDHFYNVYWEGTMKNVKKYLKPGKWFGLNILDKYTRMIDITKTHFGEPVEIVKLRTVKSHLTKNKDSAVEKFEPIFMFRNNK